jgi:hypothetical protein
MESRREIMTERNKKKILIGACAFVFVGIIAIAYAAFTQGLNINGSGVNRKSNFDIYFNNVSDFQTTGTASVVTPNPKVREHTTIIEDYEATLITPGDSIYFTFDIVNDGDYDATLKGLTLGPVKCSVNGNESDISAQNVCENIEYTIRYADNSTLQPNNDKLLSKETKSVKVTLTYKDTISADKLPTNNVSISNLGIELVYEADSEAKTNSDGSTPYEKQYTIGEEVTVKNEKYNVIGIGSDYLILLKQEALTVAEVNTYGTGHVNMHNNLGETASNQNGNGGMAYYSSETCGYVNGSWVEDGCKTNYAESEIKYVVDAWATDKFTSTDLKEVEGYKARLVQKEELRSQFYPSCSESKTSCYKESTTPRWLYNSNYYYWTMTQLNTSSSRVGRVSDVGSLGNYEVYLGYGAVRPVINLYKSKL